LPLIGIESWLPAHSSDRRKILLLTVSVVLTARDKSYQLNQPLAKYSLPYISETNILKVEWGIHPSIWLCSPFIGPWLFFSFLILYTVDRTPWKGDQTVARPLHTHRTTKTYNNVHTDIMPWVGLEPTTPVFELAKTWRHERQDCFDRQQYNLHPPILPFLAI
jgi:hypothetical protein